MGNSSDKSQEPNDSSEQVLSFDGVLVVTAAGDVGHVFDTIKKSLQHVSLCDHIDLKKNPQTRPVTAHDWMYATKSFSIQLQTSQVAGTTAEVNVLLNLSHTYCKQLTDKEIQVWLSLQDTFFDRNKIADESSRRISLAEFSFGTFAAIFSFGKSYRVKPRRHEWCKVNFEYDKRRVCLYFSDNQGCNSCLTFDVHSMHHIVHVCKTSQTIDMYFQLKRPPLMYSRIAADERRVESTDDVDLSHGKWSRRSYFALSAKNETRRISGSIVGQCDVIKLSFTTEVLDVENLQSILANFWSRDNRWNFRFAYISDYSIPQQLDNPLSGSIPFDLAYALEVLRSVGLRGILFIHRNDLQNTSTQLLYAVHQKLENESQYYLIDDKKLIAGATGSPPKQRDLCAVIATPTRLIFQRPEKYIDNRIFEKYRELVTCHAIMKVYFRDENYSAQSKNLNSIHLHKNGDDYDDEAIDTTVCQRLREGIRIAGRDYRVLGGSNSMLSEHCVYVLAPYWDEQLKITVTADIVRQRIGDLRTIANPATYLTRLGLAFSNVKGRIFIDEKCIKDERDIRRNGYCFSDGIGRISEELATRIWRKMKRKDSLPSAFQIRMGGVKGVVALDPLLEGEQLIIRDSMIKFRSSDTQLEVVEVSKPMSLRLNNQIVTLLSQLGVSDSAFWALFHEEIKDLVFALIVPSMAQRIVLDSTKRYLESFSICPEDLTTVWFARRIIAEHLREKIERIKVGEKRQISIPYDKGRNLMGVMDETGELNYGQVFIQFTTADKKPQMKVLKGMVTVSKMPALHPGDVRTFEAVDVAQLKHLHDVIVFPQMGPRPHPNEMAGSDLDGDLYFVTWLESLRLKDSQTPMDFPEHKQSTDRSKKITEEDIIEQIKFNIETDLKGIVSRRHLMFADSDGISSDKCLELAKLSAQIYDAPKTGLVPVIPHELKPQKAPDFLEKSSHMATYQSKRILGKLYREAVFLLNELDTISAFESEPTSAPDLSDDKLAHEALTRLQRQYCSQMRALSDKYRITSETELYRGKFPTKEAFEQYGKSFNEEFKDSLTILIGPIQSCLNVFEKTYGRENCKRKLYLACRDLVRSKPGLFCDGLPLLVLKSLYSDVKLPEVDQQHMDDRRNAYIAMEALSELHTSQELLISHYFASEVEQKTTRCKKYATLLKKHWWLLVACEYLLRRLCVASADRKGCVDSSHRSTMCSIISLTIRVSLQNECHQVSDLEGDVNSDKTSVTGQQKQSMEGLSVKDTKLSLEEASKLGLVITQCFWEVYTCRPGVKRNQTGGEVMREEVRQQAIRALLKIAFRVPSEQQLSDCDDRDEKTFVVRSKRLKADSRSLARSFKEQFPDLYIDFQEMSADSIKVVCRGRKSEIAKVVRRIKQRYEQ